MPQLFLFLLKINLVLVLFALTYYWLLRKFTFYTLNRFFLLLGTVFATVYPFINLTAFIGSTAPESKLRVWVPRVKDNLSSLVENPIAQMWTMAEYIFYAGLVLMGARLMIQLISLYRVHQKSHAGTINHLPVRILKEKMSPFTFWKNIYINPEIHAKQELGNILAHEQVHVKQWHTVDILLAEISLVFYWFNPGVWLMKKAVKENLEFITDHEILSKGIDRKAYQYSLLGASTVETSIALVNHFNLSDLKKRIMMMNKQRSSRIKLLFYAVVIPALLLFTLAFTVDKIAVKTQIQGITKKSTFGTATALTDKMPQKEMDRNFVKATRPVLKTTKKPVKKQFNNIQKISLELNDTLAKTPKKITFTYFASFRTDGKSIPDSVLNSIEGKVKSITIKKVVSTELYGSVTGLAQQQRKETDSVLVISGKPTIKSYQLTGDIDAKEIKHVVIKGVGSAKVIQIETKEPSKN